MPQGFAGCKANQAYTALHHGEGVWGFGKDAEIEHPKALQDAKPTKRITGAIRLCDFIKIFVASFADIINYSDILQNFDCDACIA